jgi:hypothetical protein
MVFLESDVAAALKAVVRDGDSPVSQSTTLEKKLARLPRAMPGLPLRLLLTAHQCMALAEHRRYKEQTAVGGGRYLLVRVVLGIIYGKWTADEARETTTGNDPASGRRGGLGALEALEGAKGWDSVFWSQV